MRTPKQRERAEEKERSLAEELLAEAPKKPGRKYRPRHAKPADDAAPRQQPKPDPDATKPLDEFTSDGDLVDIWERRMLNPQQAESTPIRTSTPGMKLRWINLASRGRYQRARYEQGWVPVHKSELVDEREIFGVSYTTEGYVCRGEKQSEMLMKIPQAVYRRIQERRAKLNTESYTKLRESLQNAGATHFGDKYGGSAGEQAAEAAGSFKGTLKFGTEKASAQELFE